MEKFLEQALPIVKSIAFALVVVVAGSLLIKFLSKRLDVILKKRNVDDTTRPFIVMIIRITLKVLLIVAIIGILGIDTTSFVAAFGAAGLSVGLAFQGTLSNFAGGMLIHFSKPFRVGDYIESNGYSGTVQAIQLLYTELATIDNKVVRLPNGTLSNTNIINYTDKPTRRVDLVLSANYEADSAKVIKALFEIIDSHELIMKEPEPFVRLSEYSDSSINYTVRVWVKTEDYWTVYYDILGSVKEKFDEYGISIPYPQVDVHMDKEKVNSKKI